MPTRSIDASRERTLFHVDDDPSILRLVNHTLTNRGYKVCSINDPDAVLPMLRQSLARLVLLDLDMPKKDGLTLLREIKQFDGSIQVIVVTGYASMNTIVQATCLGAEECIFKPITDLSELGEAVDRTYEKMLRWWRLLRDWTDRQEKAGIMPVGVQTFHSPYVANPPQ
jgi:DNA-binding NtrC family response regulator